MTDHALLAALQLSDSALPIGRFAHSLGLESLLSEDPEAGEDVIVEVVETLLFESIGPLDGVAVAHAHLAAGDDDLDGLLRLDRAVTVRRLTPASRVASTSCGRSLASLTCLLSSSGVAQRLATCVLNGESDGNLAIMEGAVGQCAGLDRRSSVLIGLRGSVATLLSAATRLGRLSASRNQVALLRLHAPIVRAAEEALVASVDDMRSSAIEMDIAAMSHRRRDARLFMT